MRITTQLMEGVVNVLTVKVEPVKMVARCNFLRPIRHEQMFVPVCKEDIESKEPLYSQKEYTIEQWKMSPECEVHLDIAYDPEDFKNPLVLEIVNRVSKKEIKHLKQNIEDLKLITQFHSDKCHEMESSLLKREDVIKDMVNKIIWAKQHPFKFIWYVVIKGNLPGWDY